jgi:hypothetical protein
MLSISPYSQEQHYPQICEWWKSHNVPAVPPQCLPKLGVMVSHGSQDILIAWASMDNSTGLAFYLWPTGNPLAPKRHIRQAVSHSSAYLQGVLKSFGYHTILYATHRPSLSRCFSNLGLVTDGRPLYLHLAHI